MGIREEFIKKVQEDSYTEQPTPNVVYLDGDLETLVSDMGAYIEHNERTGVFAVCRTIERAEFKCEELPNRFSDEYLTETLITLYEESK